MNYSHREGILPLSLPAEYLLVVEHGRPHRKICLMKDSTWWSGAGGLSQTEHFFLIQIPGQSWFGGMNSNLVLMAGKISICHYKIFLVANIICKFTIHNSFQEPNPSGLQELMVVVNDHFI